MRLPRSAVRRAHDRSAVARRPVSNGRRAAGARDDGAQALEFALVVPAALFVVLLVVQAGLLGVDLVHAQGVARETARAAAVGDDATAREVAERAAGGRPVEVHLDPVPRSPGDLVTATVRFDSRAFGRLGLRVPVGASATMRVEDR